MRVYGEVSEDEEGWHAGWLLQEVEMELVSSSPPHAGLQILHLS